MRGAPLIHIICGSSSTYERCIYILSCILYVAAPLIYIDIKYVWVLSYIPPEKLFEDGFSTPTALFDLICTIISNKPCILD